MKEEEEEEPEQGLCWDKLLEIVSTCASADVIVLKALMALIDEALKAIPEDGLPRARRKRAREGRLWIEQLVKLLKHQTLNDYAISMIANQHIGQLPLLSMARIALSGAGCSPLCADRLVEQLCQSGLSEHAADIADKILNRSLSADEVRALVDAYCKHDGDISQRAVQKLIELVEETLEASEASQAKASMEVASASAPLC